jgi:mRNA interferase RelE/StbE
LTGPLLREHAGKSSISNESNLPLKILVTSTPAKYLAALDKPTRKRINAKLEAIATAPYDTRLSYPLVGQTKRSSRVGGYRILFELTQDELIVSDIGPRGQIYKRL